MDNLETKNGLSSQRAAELLKELGPNELESANRSRLLRLVLSQFLSPLVLILILAAAVAFSAGLVKDAYLILSIIVLNATLGFWQEHKAERAIEALKKLTISSTLVVRDGREREIDSRHLVPGDLVILSSGQNIPADCSLLIGFNLEVNESALTGESLPVAKSGDEPEIKNLFMGTVITSGSGMAVVQKTGMHTRFGKIAVELKQVKDEPTPFQRSVTRLARTLGGLAVVSAVLVYAAGTASGLPLKEMFLVSASLAVAAVPEGLPAIVGLTLAVGVQRMARKKAVVRKMASVEALGAVTVICTDKTGTITTGEMRVRYAWFDGQAVMVEQLKEKGMEKPFSGVLEAAVLSNSAKYVEREPGKFEIVGSPTDGALLALAQDLGHRQSLIDNSLVLQSFSFSKSLKIITSVVEVGSQIKVLVHGAPERVLSLCSLWLNKGKHEQLNPEKRKALLAAMDEYAAKGFRIIGFAEKDLHAPHKNFSDRSEAEQSLHYLGFVAIYDPPRQEVKEALRKAKSAGVKTIMLTGDNILTAKAIAAEVGLFAEGDEAILGEKLDGLSDAEVDQMILSLRIVARATPEQKLRVIQSLQRKKEVVAVTGDGINDSLALKQADVGVAMGITGTDVAKQAADIVLSDDRYETIVTAIEEGRRIDDNLTRAVRYLVAGNMAEVLTVLMAMILAKGAFVPLLPVQILWINIVTDALPAFALAVGPGDPHAMRRGPKLRDEGALNKRGLKVVVVSSVLVSAVTLAAFFGTLDRGIDIARTAAFTIMVISQMIMAFVISYLHKSGKFNWRANRWLVLAVLGTIAIQGLLLIVPGLREMFHLVLY